MASRMMDDIVGFEDEIERERRLRALETRQVPVLDGGGRPAGGSVVLDGNDRRQAVVVAGDRMERRAAPPSLLRAAPRTGNGLPDGDWDAIDEANRRRREEGALYGLGAYASGPTSVRQRALADLAAERLRAERAASAMARGGAAPQPPTLVANNGAFAYVDGDGRIVVDRPPAEAAGPDAPKPVSFGGGSGVIPDGKGGWTYQVPPPVDKSEQYKHEERMENLRNSHVQALAATNNAAALERTNAEVAGRRDVAGLNNAAALERTNAEVAGRRDVAEIRAQARRDVQELKNSGALAGGGAGETQALRIQRLAGAFKSLNVELTPEQELRLADAKPEEMKAIIKAIDDQQGGILARQKLSDLLLAELGGGGSAPAAAPAATRGTDRRVWTPDN